MPRGRRRHHRGGMGSAEEVMHTGNLLSAEQAARRGESAEKVSAAATAPPSSTYAIYKGADPYKKTSLSEQNPKKTTGGWPSGATKF